MSTEWDRTKSAFAEGFDISNPATQDVSVGFIGAYRRDMSSNTCSAPEKVDNMAFSLMNKATGRFVTDSYNKSYNWLTYWYGNGWLNFQNLPAG